MAASNQFRPFFSLQGTDSNVDDESTATKAIIHALSMLKHPEGGYFVETDRDQRLVANPWASASDPEDAQRNASTSIFYLITPNRSFGAFHRNKARTVHTLHRGRGRYVIIHANEAGKNESTPRLETFVVGHDLAKGEKLQWIVEGGKYKASFLLPDDGEAGSSQGLLISEVNNKAYRCE